MTHALASSGYEFSRLTRRAQDHRHFVAPLDDDRVAAREEADKALDVVGGEGAADRALGL